MIDGMTTLLTFCVIMLGAAVIVSLVVFRDKITSIFVSRTCLEVRMDNSVVWCRFTDEIKHIDSATQNAIARATTRLEIVNPELFDMSDTALLVNYAANLQLVIATYANDHTRKIAADKGNAYLLDKTNDVANAIKQYTSKLEGLTYELAEAHVCHWFKRIVIPHIRKACNEKIEMYKRLIADSNINRSLKEIFEDRLKRNQNYILRIDEIDGREDITAKSSIFLKQ